MRVLVVGASGDLGSRTCLALLERGLDVRGSVRALDRASDLVGRGVELVLADLVDPDGWTAALAGVDVAVLTANPITPRRGDDPRRVDAGLLWLVAELGRAGVRRVVLPSIPVSAVDDQVPFARERRSLEQRLPGSVPEAAVVRFPPFMGCWLALAGSSIPLRGAAHATIGRPSPFLRTFRRATGRLVEDRGLMLVPGSPRRRNAFIDEADAARALAEAAVATDRPDGPVEVGGPEVLTWRDVADVFARILDRPVRVAATPGPVYAVLQRMTRPVGVVPSDTMALNRYAAALETVWEPGGGLLDPAGLTTVRDYLATRLALPEALPTVP